MWTIEQANQWYHKQKWMVGCNYLPSTAINSTEMWQADTFDLCQIEKELAAAAAYGYNSVRVFFQFLVYQNERESFLKNLNSFVGLCKKYNLTVMPVLFDDCAFSGKEPFNGPQQSPMSGIHNSGWTPSPGFANADNVSLRPVLKQYVQEIISSYQNNATILLWDLYNEAGNSGREEKSLSLLEAVFAWAREISPSQPLTSGMWEWGKPYSIRCVQLSDVVSFHDYCAMDITQNRVEKLLQTKRPLICTEWLHRLQNNRIETHLAYYQTQKIGIYNWGFIKGKSQTHLSWNAEENCINGEPREWQHDILYENLVPYSLQETALFKKIIQGG